MSHEDNHAQLFLASLLFVPQIKTGQEILAAQTLMGEALKYVDDSHFVDTQLRELWRVLRDLHAAGTILTPAAVVSSLKDKIGRESFGKLLSELLVDKRPLVTGPHNLKFHAAGMIESSRKLYLQTRLLEFITRLDAESSLDVMADLSDLSARIAVKQLEQEPLPIDQCLDDTIAELERRVGGGIGAARWGIATLDSMFDRGIEPSDLVIIAGRPGSGKTAFCLQLAALHVREGKKILFASVEMATHQLIQRMWSSESGIPIRRLFGKEYEFRSEKAGRAGDTIRSWRDRLWVLQAENRFENLASTIRLYRQQHGIDGVVIDFVGLLRTSNRYEKRHLEVGQYAVQLKQLCNSLGLYVILVSQLNRDSVQQGEYSRPRMSQLYESGGLEQAADLILFTYQDRERTQTDGEKKPITLWCEKNRFEEPQRGALAWFVGATQHIVDAPERAHEGGLDTSGPLYYNETRQSRFEGASSSPF